MKLIEGFSVEGDYFEAYYDEGRKKINTMEEETDSLGIKDTQKVITFNSTYIKALKRNEGILSLAFRPKDYFTSIISSYYFRVLYKKENEIKYLPMDSNFGNLCIPEKDPSSAANGNYFCYLILKNNYNESNLNFSVSSTNQNEYVRINIAGIFNNTISFNEFDYYIYVYIHNKIDVDYFLVKFKFKNNKIKNIISAFCDRVNGTNPQIYSAQMFYLNNFNKTHYFKLKNSFSGNYQFISGASGIIEDMFSFSNFKRKLISLAITKNFILNIATITEEFIYYFQLIHNLKSQEIKELKQGKPLVEFIKKPRYPILYYYKINNNEYINVNINFKINDHNESLIKNYSAKGYILDEDKIIKKINGEYIEIPDPYEGKYSDAYGIGLLQVNKQMTEKEINGTKYLLFLIEKTSNQNEKTSPYFYVEIMVKEYDEKNGFFLPQNGYFLDTFDDAKNGIREVNQYSIFNPEGTFIQPVFELSSQYSDIKINFTNNITYDI